MIIIRYIQVFKLLSMCKYLLIIIVLFSLTGCNSSYNYKNNDTDKNITNNFSNTETNKIGINTLLKETEMKNNIFKPLFEDHQPHNIGDTITIILQENLSSSHKTYSNISHNGTSSFSMNLPTMSETYSSHYGNKLGLDGLAKNNFFGKGSSSDQNSFLGVITVTIKNILPNGNFNIYGEKEISINKQKEFIRFSGVINPYSISKNNTVISTQVANAHIEYINNHYVNTANKIGWLQHFLFKVSPM